MRGRRRKSQRRLFDEQPPDAQLERHTHQSIRINDLPEPILLEIFRHLGTLPPVATPEEAALYTRALPFKTFEHPGECHPGLRSYPFLAQVCRLWKAVLECPAALQLWQELVVDFGHELVTGVHVPVAWSDVRPTDAEFRQAFAAVSLRSHRLVEFVRARRGVLRRLVLTNSEGYWAEDGEFVSLARKHDFNLGTLGILLGMLDNLEELQISHCNDLFASGSTPSTIAMFRGLRSLVLEDLHGCLYRKDLDELARLTNLRELSICATLREGLHFVAGVEAIPDSWRSLSRLTSLELRGNTLLKDLPPWLAGAMPALRLLDVGGCKSLNPHCLTTFTQLETLGLQALDLICDADMPRLLVQAAAQGLLAHMRRAPDLSPLTRLRALNLADNCFSRPPPWLPKLGALEVLDLSHNFFLQAPQPLTPLTALTNLRYLDLRAIHEEEGKFWSEGKCATMQHVAALGRALRRKNRHCRLLHDTS